MQRENVTAEHPYGLRCFSHSLLGVLMSNGKTSVQLLNIDSIFLCLTCDANNNQPWVIAFR